MRANSAFGAWAVLERQRGERGLGYIRPDSAMLALYAYPAQTAFIWKGRGQAANKNA
jgi:hypothetical protein